MEDREATPAGPVIGEYKGNPVITLNPGERFPFTFGVSKARLILQHLEDIRAFVDKYGEKK
ncbi:MAG TPA: hypothetical protein PK843_06945 [bacterium]|nr:hypothetical protein [bacterium]HPN34230.1 hypothetical protein [bacterium]